MVSVAHGGGSGARLAVERPPEPVAEVEFPFPALVIADLHVVMCRLPRAGTCAPCWAALWPGSRTPALPATRQKRGRIARRPRRVVHASAATTCSSSSAMSFSQPTAGAQIAPSGTTQADGATSHAATHNGGCG
jgi:hypothetical protein